MSDYTHIIYENNSRNSRLKAYEECYDPVMGFHAYGERRRVDHSPDGRHGCFVPLDMINDPAYSTHLSSREWQILRARHDFEFWCATCVHIKPKAGWTDVPFRLNSAQRHVLPVLEDDRRAGRPIRLIMLKSRQWGGSTLVQVYMAWIQILHRSNWHSLICSHVRDASTNILGMYNKILASYPADLWPVDAKPELKRFESSSNTRVLPVLGNRVTLGSAESQDAIRGQDYAMAHLSEVAFWPETRTLNPEDFLRAIVGSVAPMPLSMIVMESTANGVGNFFHTEWLRNENGEGDKHCVFVPWYMVEHCRMALHEYTERGIAGFVDSWTQYDWQLWRDGRTLEMINWYRLRVREMGSIHKVHAEFPTTPREAFTSTGANVFDDEAIERLRASCRTPRIIGDIDDRSGRLVEAANGRFRVWEKPDNCTQYVVAMDIGGRSDTADFSVIAVLTHEEKPRVVAQWRGHTDHDILARIAIAIATMYNKAELIIESNTLESEGPVLDNNLTVLTYIQRKYKKLYHRRTDADSGHTSRTAQVGFHTNRRTKPLLINNLITYVRLGKYVEVDNLALNEYHTYVEMPNGAYAARQGNHDDILMSRALALYLIDTERLPRQSPGIPAKSNSI